jgi:hypothetical protein
MDIGWGQYCDIQVTIGQDGSYIIYLLEANGGPSCRQTRLVGHSTAIVSTQTFLLLCFGRTRTR